MAVRLLADRGDVDADSYDRQMWTPLGHAAHSGQKAIVRLLLKRGCSKDYFAPSPPERTTERHTYDRMMVFINECLAEEGLRT